MQATSASSLRGASTPDAQEAATQPSSPLRARRSSCASGDSAAAAARATAPARLPAPDAHGASSGGSGGSISGAGLTLVEQGRSRSLRGELGNGAPGLGSCGALQPVSQLPLPSTGMRRRGPNPFATQSRGKSVHI